MEDPEIERIKQKKLAEMLKQQQDALAQSQHGVVELSSADFDQVTSKGLVLVDFWAEWCGPCRMVGPVVEELARDYEGKVEFVKVNVDEANELAAKYNIFSIPTLMLIHKGQVIAQQVGAASKEAYKNMIERALAKI